MDEGRNRPASPAKHHTTVERASDRELVVTRTFDGPARLVFQAWTTPELLARWWCPASSGVTMLSCEVDARTGGSYRFVFRLGDRELAFFGRYLEVVQDARLVTTSDESEDGATTTVTFEEAHGRTRMVMRELYPTKEALDRSIEGMDSGASEQHAQLDALLAELGAA